MDLGRRAERLCTPKASRQRYSSDSNGAGVLERNTPPSLASPASVSVLTEMDPWSASTRYRAIQYVPRLQERFASVTVSHAGDTVVRHPGRVGQVAYFATHAARYARRSTTLRSAVAGRDSLLIQRGLYPIGPALIVHALDGFSGRIVFDLDDAVFRMSPKIASKNRPARWLYGPQQALELMRRADAIVVSTQVLADLLPDGLPEPTIIPTVPDPAEYSVVTPEDGLPVRVGWAGTVGGLSYLDPLTEVFRRLADDGLIEVEVVSSHPWDGPATFRRWSLEEEISIFNRFGIGIMPLPDTAYTRAKAGFKLLQYMAAGLPIIASPIGVNTELLSRSGAGVLADGPSEWELALRTLVLDIELRRKMGQAGRAFVEGYVDLDANADTLARLLAM